MRTLTYVTNTDGDWEAIYIDGKLNYEGHSIPAYVWFNLTGIYSGRSEFEVMSEWLEDEGGTFPNNFEEIPKEKFV